MTCIAVDSTLAGPFCLPKLASPTSRVRKSSAVGGSLSPRSMVFGSTPPSAPLTKVGLEPRGAALAIATGACISASYALLQDHDLQRTKKTVAGGALGFFGCYLFLRGSRFDDAQTAAVFAGAITLLSIGSYARYRSR